MPQRSKNLLEAFNTSQKAEKRESGSAPEGQSTARAGGPFAAGSTRVEAPAPRAQPEPPPAPPPSRSAKVVLPPIPQAFDSFLKSTLPLLVTVALAAFLLGRASVRRVDAGAEGGDPSSSSVNRAERAAGMAPTERQLEPTRPQATPIPAESSEPTDLAPLFDPKNKYTIRAAQYAKREGPAKVGWKAYAYLKGKGFEVFPLYDGEKKYQLFIGAAALQLHLDDALAELRRIDGPSGTPGA